MEKYLKRALGRWGLDLRMAGLHMGIFIDAEAMAES